MGSLLKNEYIKLFKRLKTWIIIGLALVGAGLLTFVLYNDEKNMLEWQNPANRIEMEKDQIKYEREYLEDVEKEFKLAKTETEKEEIQYRIDDSVRIIAEKEKEIERLEILVKNPLDWKESIKIEIAGLKEQIDFIKGENKKTPDMLNELTYLEEELSQKEYYLNNSIEPIEDWRFYPANALLNVGMVLLFLIPLFIAIFGSDIVSDEATNETFKFLLIQPVKRGKVLLAKFITLITTATGIILSIQGIIFLGIGAMRGFNDLAQRVKIGVKYRINQEILIKEGYRSFEVVPGTGEYVTRGELLLMSIGLQILFILACCALVFMISTICKSNMVSAAIGVVILVGGAVAPMMIYGIGKYLHPVFLSYGATAAVITGEAQLMYENPNITVGLGVILMVATIIISYVIAHVNFSKKDILV